MSATLTRRQHAVINIDNSLGLLDGRIPSSWFHHETAEFDALGPPGTTIRVYYARHAGQVIVLHAAEGKHGAGKLAMRTKRTVTRRLASWKRSYPKGRSR